MSLNNFLWQKYLSIRYVQSRRKERNHKYFQLIKFWHPNNHPNNEGQMHNQVDKALNLFDMLMK